MSRRNRRSFTDEFKHEAASLVVTQGYSVAEACRAMGVGPTAMRRWVEQLEGEHNGVTPKAQAMTPEQQRIQELESQVKRLEREKSILKKATALLMSDEMQHLR
jgi:transposase